MAKSKLSDLSVGDVFRSKKINDIHNALIGPIVGRGSKGQPLDGQKLGTSSFSWNDINAYRFFDDNIEIDLREFSSKANSILSGATRSGLGSQPVYIIPAGTGGGAECTIKASVTPLVYKVNGQSFILENDIVITGLLIEIDPEAFADVDESGAATQPETLTLGEEIWVKKDITVKNASASYLGQVGRWGTFQKTAVDELFFCFLTSSTTLSFVHRGFFYNEDTDPLEREFLSFDDRITLRRTGWIFLEDDLATTEVTYERPKVQSTEPTFPAAQVADYWLDLSTDQWKRFNGTSFVVINRTMVGKVVINSADCIGARSEPFFDLPNNISNLKFEKVSNTVMELSSLYGMLQHDSITSLIGRSKYQFDTATDFASVPNFNDSSTPGSIKDRLALYLTDKFEPKISNHLPYFLATEGTFKHPHQNWRCAAVSNFDTQFDNHLSLATNEFSRPLGFENINFVLKNFSSNVFSVITIDTVDLAHGALIRVDGNFWHYLKTGLYQYEVECRVVTDIDAFEPQVIDTLIFAIGEDGNNNAHLEFPRCRAIRLIAEPTPFSYFKLRSIRRVTNTIFLYRLVVRLGGSTSPQLNVNIKETKLRIKYLGD